ncbi:ROK family protein, partial [Patescibacteria group bacterium]
QGIIISDTNMGGIHNLYLKATLERKIGGISVMVDGDAHCFTLAESKFGAGKKYKDIIGITLGTGIGGGIIIDKKLYRGVDNTAGEIGHIIIDADSEAVCGCGGYGHWESLASGRALQNLYKKITDQDADIDLIIDMALKGEKIAQKSIIQIGFSFSLGLASIINSLNPEIVVIGGGLSNIEFLWKVILNNLPNYLMREHLKKTKIVRAKLGDNAGIIGASLLF